MSGGAFQYEQYKIGQIADQIAEVIEANDSTEANRYGDILGRGYSSEVVEKLQEAVKALRIAFVYAHRADWLFSCDDGQPACQWGVIE